MGLMRAKQKESGNFNMVGIIIKWNDNQRLPYDVLHSNKTENRVDRVAPLKHR